MSGKTVKHKKTKIACMQCRKSKKKCDGLSPCGQCRKNKKKNAPTCTYSCSTMRIDKSQIDLQNGIVQRKYAESYLEGLNPVVMFNRTNGIFSLDSLSHTASKPKLLQLNSILATATRSFGAPENIYKCFERNAISLANELTNDYTYDAALGFNFLSFFFWGQDDNKSNFYRDTAIQISTTAMNDPKNIYDRRNLAELRLESMTIRNLCKNINHYREISTSIPTEVRLENLSSVIESDRLQTTDIIKWAEIVYKLELLFGLESDDDFFNSMDEATLQSNLETLRTCANNVPISKMPSYLLVISTYFLANGLFYYAGGYIKEAIDFIKRGVDIFIENNYLIGLSGPFTVGMFHGCFLVAFRSRHFLLAQQINNIQEKQASLLNLSTFYYEKDKAFLASSSSLNDFSIEVIDTTLNTTPSPTFSPSSLEPKVEFKSELTESRQAEFVVSNSSSENPNPFGWMTNVQVPIISSYPPSSQPSTPWSS